ncbi:MAG: hypothetical protein AAFP20_18575 [Cyanobacteria bacterium J06614_10]
MSLHKNNNHVYASAKCLLALPGDLLAPRICLDDLPWYAGVMSDRTLILRDRLLTSPM